MKNFLLKQYKILVGWYLATKHAVAFVVQPTRKGDIQWDIRFPNLLLPAVVHIDPQKINTMGSMPLKPSKGCAFFFDGSWDQQAKTVAQSENANPKHKTCKEIVLEDKDLRLTAEYRMILEYIAANGQYRKCKNERDAHAYMVGRKALYAQMKLGYKSQKALGFSRFLDEIQTAVSSTGELMQVNAGNHRFVAAYYLGLKQVPVHLAVMHAQLFKGQYHKNRFEFLRAVRQKIKDVEARYA